MRDRVRFSPALDGPLHLGGARVALFNHLAARTVRGTLVLRFEDIGAGAGAPGFEASIEEDLRWLGIAWDEGPDVGGGRGPYRRSERRELYAKALAKLEGAGRVYPCFCPADGRATDRDPDASAGCAPSCSGACASLESAEAASRVAAGEPHRLRFRVAADESIAFSDIVHGEITFSARGIGDFIVAHVDGEAADDLACVVDDASMNITLVVRGDEHIPATPRQLLLFAALGRKAPRYAHVPPVLGRDGRPLASARGAEPISALREAGFLPQAVVNHLALLGWSHPEATEVLTLPDLERAFDLSRVSSSESAHDAARLRWFNKRHFAALPVPERVALIEPHLGSLEPADRTRAARLLVDEVEVPADVVDLVAGVGEALPSDDEALAALGVKLAGSAIETAAAALHEGGGGDAVRVALRSAGLPARDAMPAVRAALTGRAHGLPVAVLVDLIGAREAARRLEAVLQG